MPANVGVSAAARHFCPDQGRMLEAGSSGSTTGAAAVQPFLRYSAMTFVVMPPRTFQRATMRTKRGFVAATMSSMIVFVTSSWNEPTSR